MNDKSESQEEIDLESTSEEYECDWINYESSNSASSSNELCSNAQQLILSKFGSAKEAWKKFDRKNTGYLILPKLQLTLHELFSFNEKEAIQIFQFLDMDRDGLISLSDWNNSFNIWGRKKHSELHLSLPLYIGDKEGKSELIKRDSGIILPPDILRVSKPNSKNQTPKEKNKQEIEESGRNINKNIINTTTTSNEIEEPTIPQPQISPPSIDIDMQGSGKGRRSESDTGAAMGEDILRWEEPPIHSPHSNSFHIPISTLKEGHSSHLYKGSLSEGKDNHEESNSLLQSALLQDDMNRLIQTIERMSEDDFSAGDSYDIEPDLDPIPYPLLRRTPPEENSPMGKVNKIGRVAGESNSVYNPNSVLSPGIHLPQYPKSTGKEEGGKVQNFRDMVFPQEQIFQQTYLTSYPAAMKTSKAKSGLDLQYEKLFSRNSTDDAGFLGGKMGAEYTSMRNKLGLSGDNESTMADSGSLRAGRNNHLNPKLLLDHIHQKNKGEIATLGNLNLIRNKSKNKIVTTCLKTGLLRGSQGLMNNNKLCGNENTSSTFLKPGYQLQLTQPKKNKSNYLQEFTNNFGSQNNLSQISSKYNTNPIKRLCTQKVKETNFGLDKNSFLNSNSKILGELKYGINNQKLRLKENMPFGNSNSNHIELEYNQCLSSIIEMSGILQQKHYNITRTRQVIYVYIILL